MAREHEREHDYIPQNDYEFDAFYKNYCVIVGKRTSGTPPVWPHIPLDRTIELNTGYTAWDTAWKAYQADSTKILNAAKETAKKAGAKLVRDFTNEFIRYSSQVSDDDRRLLGVHVPDPTPTPVPVPPTRPEFNLRVVEVC